MFAGARKKITGFLKQGITGKKLALTCSIGLLLGTIPLLGTTSAFCGLAALRLRLNMAAIQAVNYILYPLQILLFIPYIKLGTMIFGYPFNYSLSQIFGMMKNDLWNAITTLFAANMFGVLLWAVTMPIISWVLFFPLKIIFERVEQRIRER